LEEEICQNIYVHSQGVLELAKLEAVSGGLKITLKRELHRDQKMNSVSAAG